MSYAPIFQLLQRAIGFDVSSVGFRTVEGAVQRRRQATGQRSVPEYTDLVLNSAEELQQLIETVVVSETFFFRHPEAFAALQRLAATEFLFSSQRLHLLSVACATGEEPYSAAMSLLDGGLPPDRFQIDAIDVSRQALQKAESGYFEKSSFRGVHLASCSKYFTSAGIGFQISDAVRSQVRFQQGNILEMAAPAQSYQIIFCRNLLIYFNSQTQKQAMQHLRLLLAEQGVLFVGPAESSVVVQEGFVSQKMPMAFAFRRAEEEATTPRKKAGMPRAELSPRKSASVLPGARNGLFPKPARSMVQVGEQLKDGPRRNESEEVGDLTAVLALADRGRLQEAEEICRQYLRQDDSSPQAFYLLGLIRDGRGDEARAMASYRKALYLDPNHYEALVQLALLSERNGDQGGADLLRARARRLQQRSG